MHDNTRGLYNLPPLHNDQIRLLRVEQGESGKIECLVTVHSLSDTSQEFSALSYTWGPCHGDGIKLRRLSGSTDVPRTVVCNNSPVEVTENLYDFFCQWTADQKAPTHIWVDALSIDQDNTAERNHQVHIMGQIYTAAKHVFIWLGPEDDSTVLAFELMEGLNSMRPKARATLNPQEVSAGNENFLLELSNWKALSHFFARKWFSRAWIIQEAVFARTCTVLCGPHSISWDKLATTSKFLATSNWTNFLKDPTYFEDHTNPWHNTPARLLAQFKTWKGSYKEGLLYALIRARPSLCQNPKDKVYSQLHLGRADVFPDYNRSISEVYTAVAEYIIKQSESLLLLTCVEGDDYQNATYDLPSWVPDWSDTRFVGLRMTGYRHFHAAGKRPPMSFISQNKRILTVEATKADQILEICEDKRTLRATLHSSKLWGLLSRLPSTYSTEHGIQSREAVAWRSLMTNRGSTVTDSKAQYPASDEFEQSFRCWVLWRYASAIEELSAFPVPSATTSILPTQAELEETRLRARTDPMYLAQLAHQASPYDLHFSHAMLQRPFRTQQGSFGIGTQCLREGDSIWIVSGCRVPLILRRIDGSEHYRLVGGSYTHGLMDGEGLCRPNTKFEMVSLE